ncbi:MAG: penicillin-binding transpeptidase domain-containing protein [Coriobacteriia bacterium]|nr:penicillin-binding transpeptidase domain-containing protein [Coriobacteriia bacterium]
MTGKRRVPGRGPRIGRFVGLLAVIAALLVGVAGRLVYIQVIVGPEYAAAAEQQRTCDVVLTPRRGSIFDREGEPLAVTVDAKTIYAVPSQVTDPEGVATQLSEVLGGDRQTYLSKLLKDASFVYIERKVDMETADVLKKLDLTGIAFLDDSRRVYPSNELACQVLGFVGIDDEGLAGLEKYYDQTLAGIEGRLIAERGRSGIPIPDGVTYEEPPVDGENLVLTIDKDIQYQAHLELEKTVEEWDAKGGSVIIMDPKTGEILAMASTPAFNPNEFGKSNESAFRNRAIVDSYEPGSTIKSMTAAAVIEEGLFTPSSMFDLPPTLEVGGRTIHESHSRPRVEWTLAEIVTNSSNIGAVKLGLALGEERLYDYFARFGLTERTGVDFPGEAKGYLPPVEQWSSSSIGNIPFGQGISVTALQLARALAAIANGGQLVTPHFLRSMPDSPEQQLSWTKEEAISAKTAAEMRNVMKAVVTEGTGSAAKVAGYEVAGKTGTAQKARTDGVAGYESGKYVASFSGFLPADDPAVLIIVTVDEPKNGYYGGAVAAPAFSRLASFCVTHLKVPPTSSAEGTSLPVTGSSQGTGE